MSPVTKENEMGFGIGVMIGALGGSQSENEKSITNAIGREISSIEHDDSNIRVIFSDGSKLVIKDDGQSCCEKRYITSDDMPCETSEGETLVSVESADMPTLDDEHGEPHEQCAVKIQTSRQCLTFVTHNEHNGYYGGFLLVASLKE